MKKMNDVFATLKSVMPTDSKIDNEEEKETKVTTLRSAIQYINYLKKLIEDCDAGLVDKTEYNEKGIKNDEPICGMVQKHKNPKTAKTSKKSPKTLKSTVKSSKPVTLDAKWTNYSPQFLEQKI